MASAAAPADFHGSATRRHLVVRGGPQAGRRFVLQGELTIGRSASADILLEDEQVSRSHALVRQRADGTLQLVDLGSRNGSIVNGERTDAIDLETGDHVQLGRTMLVVGEEDSTADQRLQSERFEMLGQLCAGVVHDLNNALCAITASAGYLREQTGEWQVDSLECIDDIQLAANHSTKLARQLLAFARGEGAQPRRVDIATFADEMVKLTHRTFPRDVEVQIEAEPELIVHAEPSRLNQILLNLLVNARDAIAGAQRPGKIVVTARRAPVSAGRAVEICVADDGAGMDASTRARIFEPFFSTKSGGKSFGLGLATVSQLVTELGGTIRVESSPGEGSVFLVTLPAAPEANGRERSHTLPVASPVLRRGHGQRILVVDEDLWTRRTLRRVLARVGFHVIEACTGSEAVELLARTEGVRVAILDPDVPRQSNMDLLAHLKQREPAIAVIALSSGSDLDALTRARARGAYAAFPKPPSPADLVACTFDALDGVARREDFDAHTQVSD
jgi:signal transduction histidine kinase/ActR/RegA family two-component response regulator